MIGLVVVLLLLLLGGAAAAAVVWAPWEDDDASEKAEDTGEESTEESEDDESTGATDATTDPTGPTGPPTDGPTDGPVTADVNGDGYGDVVASFLDDGYERLTYSSDGSAFTEERTPLEQEERVVWADFDGDGTQEIVALHVTLGTVVLEDADGNEIASYDDFGLWEDASYYVNIVAGDMTGDGLPDLVLAGQTDKDVVSLAVVASNGDGFDDPAPWGTLENATVAATRMWAGDFDADGATDVLVTRPLGTVKKDDYDSFIFYDPLGTALLTSTGASFDIGETVDDGLSLNDRVTVVGDFSGEGTPLLALNNYWDSEFNVYEYDGSSFVERPELTVSYEQVAGGMVVVTHAATDVDGDGNDDIAFVAYNYDKGKYDDIRVTLSTGDGFATPEPFGATPKCESSCGMQFQGGE